MAAFRQLMDMVLRERQPAFKTSGIASNGALLASVPLRDHHRVVASGCAGKDICSWMVSFEKSALHPLDCYHDR
jgi:hypothetical protein